ncbi:MULTISPECIES: response regulator transcription factor [Burkholderia]|uniref:Response regulator transcription factor n=1 Tax=Burkholderia anthina TaxID=179879 RepID=A0A6P2GAU6_9BURK|nr:MULTISPECIES: response regulator transcription factor [Burkholderia]AXK61887.1 DNA-binding response regulator [Burkholderia sp. IDO3]MBM2768370.1 response regulator transcription factor [Burkholderia anthina]PCD60267.1 DNA-binding response regulator [Burkholderia sp. IDO3]QTD94287.1 response regulator transcription factor [Burkholderia anthina]VVU50833.1 two-component system, response regulator [Burkholderia anthina]
MTVFQDTRVVVADDHPITRLAVIRAINALPGFKVVADVGSGHDLVRILTEQACDLIVTDFTMQQSEPDEDGLRLIEKLRRLHESIPVVVFTMLTNGGILHRLCQMGVAGLVGKDEDLAALEKTCTLAPGPNRPYLSPGMAARLAQAGELAVGAISSRLSPKELEIVRLFALGTSLTDIARQLNRSITTVSTQKRSAMRKLHVTTNADLIAYAREQGLV